MLEVDLSDVDRRKFDTIRNRRTKKIYLRMEYEVRVEFDYPRLTYEIIIPQNGKFPDSENWGNDPIRKPAILNCAAAIEVNGPQTMETPRRSRVGIFPTTVDGGACMAGPPKPSRHIINCYGSRRSLDRSAQEKSCQRCCRLRVKCVRKSHKGQCYRCGKAGKECLSRS